MGIYDSNLSVWERNKRGLPADHAGSGVIGEDKNKVEEINELLEQIQSDVVPDQEDVETPLKGIVKPKPLKK
jgi:hypothetical protein